MKCVECSRFTLRQNPDMAKVGYGNCARLKNYEFRAAMYESDCKDFFVAKGEDVKKRLDWLESKNKKEAANE